MHGQLALTVAFLGLSPFVSAHIALWDPAMFGYDTSDPNQSEPVLPLMDLTFSEWWFHGYIDKPPADDTFMILPSGGTYHGQVACNKALTTLGDNPSQQTGIYACEGTGSSGGIGALHTTDAWASPNPTNVKGCGISIAYTSDEHSVQPEDFAVISTNQSCPWFKHVDFQIPSDLPPCPEGGCLCSWGWIHSELSGSEQNYHLVYRCKIDGASGTTALPKANTANKCDYPTDTSNCTVGAKQPHYWFQKERNNNPQGTYDPPFYNGKYGFMDGAQTDLFAAANGSTSQTTTSSTSSSSLPTSTVAAVTSSTASIAVSSSAALTTSTHSTKSPVSTTATVSTSSAVSTTSAVSATSSASATTSSSVTLITSANSTTSSVPTTSGISTTLSIPATTSSSAILFTSANSTTSAVLSTSTVSTTSSVPATTSSGASNQCRRRKRALEIVEASPEAARRHRERNAKVAHRRSLRNQSSP